MNTKKSLGGNHVLNNRLHTYQQSNDCYTFSNDVSNWKSVLHVHSKKKEICSNEIECYLRKYFSNHLSTIHQYCKMNDFINRQTFECILRSSGILIDDICLESLWNSCQPSDKGISYEIFRQRFAPFELENNQNSNNTVLSLKQCRIVNYMTSICHIVKKYWQNLKDDFFSLDRYGRLFITVDQAINLMKKYCFPLNDKQQCELAILFSPKNNGQFDYFDFMQYFTTRSTLKHLNQGIFSRSTYPIQSKQSWTVSSITIDCILNRIRSQCIRKYESIYRMFRIIDKNRQGYLTKIKFNHLLKQFDIHLDDEEFYHVMSEIDKNQDGIISYDELYYSLITDTFQI